MSEQVMPQRLLNGRVVLWQFVEDLPRAVQWYSDTFGIESGDNIGHAYFFPINENTTLALSVSRINGQQIGSSNSEMLDFQCDDIFHTHNVLKEKGVRVEAEVRNPAWVYHEFFLWDPDGNKMRMHGFVQESKKVQQRITAGPKIVVVSDMLKSEKYYIDVLGFKKDDCGELHKGELKFLLHEGSITPIGTAWHSYAYTANGDELDALYDEFSSKGAIFAEKARMVSETWKEFIVQDYDGNKIAFGSNLSPD